MGGYADDIATHVAGHTVEQTSPNESVLLYGVEVWANFLGVCSASCTSAKTGPLRFASAFRTASERVLILIMRVILVALLSKNRQAMCKGNGDDSRKVWRLAKNSRIH